MKHVFTKVAIPLVKEAAKDVTQKPSIRNFATDVAKHVLEGNHSAATKVTVDAAKHIGKQHVTEPFGKNVTKAKLMAFTGLTVGIPIGLTKGSIHLNELNRSTEEYIGNIPSLKAHSDLRERQSEALMESFD